MEYAVQLVVPVLLGLFAGIWLDNHYPTRPWGVLAGLVLGIVLGIGSLYKRAMLMMDQSKYSKDNPGHPPSDKNR